MKGVGLRLTTYCYSALRLPLEMGHRRVNRSDDLEGGCMYCVIPGKCKKKIVCVFGNASNFILKIIIILTSLIPPWSCQVYGSAGN